MDNTIGGMHTCVFLLSSHDLSNFFLDVIMTLECEKYWLCISILSIDEASSIFKFLLQSELVLLDQVLLVVLNTGESKDAVLDMVSHLHLVDVDSLLIILLDISTRYEIFQCIMTLLVNFL